MVLNTGVACTVNQAMKAVLRIPRPWIRDERIVPVKEALPSAGGYSFPSGHTTRSGCAYGSYGMELLKKKEKGAGILFFLIILLIMLSRNWLGVHTLEDVLIGLLIVILGHLFLDKALSWAEKGGKRDMILSFILCGLVCLPMIWLGCLSNSGFCLGAYLGWVLERRFIHFMIPEDNVRKIKRGLPGLLIILLITTAFQRSLNSLLTGSYASFCSSFFLGIFIMAVYPAIYTWPDKTKRSIVMIITVIIFLLPFGIGLVHAETMKEIAVIGHRGFAAAAPENTMPAFEKAVEQGVDYIELDVQLTSDRQIVVCHDGNLQRTTGIEAELASLSLAELKQLDAGLWFSSEFAGTQIPTLEEVLILIKPTDIKIYLELKDIGEDTEFPLEVYRLTEKYQMADRCIYASFQYEYLKAIKAEFSNAKILLNTTVSETTLPEEYPSDYYGIMFSSFSAELADAIHQKGAFAFVWTVDDPVKMKEAIDAGADGICSNSPDLVQAYLNDNKE